MQPRLIRVELSWPKCLGSTLSDFMIRLWRSVRFQAYVFNEGFSRSSNKGQTRMLLPWGQGHHVEVACASALIVTVQSVFFFTSATWICVLVAVKLTVDIPVMVTRSKKSWHNSGTKLKHLERNSFSLEDFSRYCYAAIYNICSGEWKYSYDEMLCCRD